MNDLVYLSPNTEEPFTTSEVIAECAGVKRDTVQKLVQRHEKDLHEFGKVGFGIRPLSGSKTGQTVKVYHLNEQQATLLLTFLRNTPVVIEFKKELVRQFFAMRKAAHGVSLEISERDAHFIRVLDAQKASGKGLFGSGFLLSEKAAAEKAAAEKAAAEKVRVCNTNVWELSDREKKIVAGLGHDE